LKNYQKGVFKENCNPLKARKVNNCFSSRLQAECLQVNDNDFFGWLHTKVVARNRKR